MSQNEDIDENLKKVTDKHKVDWDVRSCSSFSEDYGRWAKLKPGLELPV